MRKIWIAVLIVVSLVGGVLAQANLYLEPSDINVDVGEEFEINVSISDVVDLYGFQTDIDYNSDVLEYVSMSEGDFLNSDGVDTFDIGPDDSVPGILDDYALTRVGSHPGVDGNGIIAKIRFKAIALGVSKIGIFNDKLVDSSTSVTLIPHSTENASVVVGTFVSFDLTPSNLDFGVLNPGQESNVQEINLTSGSSALLVSISASDGIFENILLDIGNGYNVIGSEQINVDADTSKSINSKLQVPVGYHSGSYDGVITYTALASV